MNLLQNFRHLHPQSLTSNLKMNHCKRRFLTWKPSFQTFQQLVFGEVQYPLVVKQSHFGDFLTPDYLWTCSLQRHRKTTYSRWWFQIFFIFTPYLGKIPILTFIFFNWVGSTTNQYFVESNVVGRTSAYALSSRRFFLDAKNRERKSWPLKSAFLMLKE